jgi:hypothetical protein
MAMRKPGLEGATGPTPEQRAALDESDVAGCSAAKLGVDPYLALAPKMEENIRKYGWSVASVFGEDEHGSAPFAYSVGAHSRDLPDIFVSGLGGETGLRLINAALNAASAGLNLEVGCDYDEIANVPVRFVPISAAEASRHMKFALRNAKEANRPFRALQLVYPDVQGRFPEDDGYAIRCQELLRKV